MWEQWQCCARDGEMERERCVFIWRFVEAVWPNWEREFGDGCGRWQIWRRITLEFSTEWPLLLDHWKFMLGGFIFQVWLQQLHCTARRISFTAEIKWFLFCFVLFFFSVFVLFSFSGLEREGQGRQLNEFLLFCLVGCCSMYMELEHVWHITSIDLDPCFMTLDLIGFR